MSANGYVLFIGKRHHISCSLVTAGIFTPNKKCQNALKILVEPQVYTVPQTFQVPHWPSESPRVRWKAVKKQREKNYE